MSKFKTKVLAITLTTLVLSLSACATTREVTTPPEEPTSGIANPASVYCKEEGGQVEIRTGADGGQYGVCVFADGSECDEWEFFSNKCQMGDQSAAPSPVPVPSYINGQYGFSLNPPSEWVVEVYDHYLHFVRQMDDQKYILMVGFRDASEEPRPFRGGMAAGDIIQGDPYTFMGETKSREMLVYDGKTKSVIYGSEIPVGHLLVSIYLDPDYANSSYETLMIPPEIIEEADQIIATFSNYP